MMVAKRCPMSQSSSSLLFGTLLSLGFAIALPIGCGGSSNAPSVGADVPACTGDCTCTGSTCTCKAGGKCSFGAAGGAGASGAGADGGTLPDGGVAPPNGATYTCDSKN